MRRPRFMMFLISGFCWINAGLFAQGEPRSSPEQRLAFAKQAAEEYRFRVAERDKPEVKLHPKPLLRWNNQVIREDDGLLFLWTEGELGRPVASAQFFVVDTVWHHEFQSLLDELANGLHDSFCRALGPNQDVAVVSIPAEFQPAAL